jgi:hypothetical protein
MKVNIELDLTTDEAKELFVPSEKQAEFGSQIYEKWLEAVQKSTMDLMNPANYVKDENKRNSLE